MGQGGVFLARSVAGRGRHRARAFLLTGAQEQACEAAPQCLPETPQCLPVHLRGSTMPRTRRSDAEQVKHWGSCSAAAAHRIHAKWCAAVMEAHPSCVVLVRSHLEALGYQCPPQDAQGSVGEVAGQETLKRTLDGLKRRGSRVKAEESEAGGEFGLEGIDKSSLVPGTYWKLSALSKSLLYSQVLGRVGLPGLSAANLKAALDPLGTMVAHQTCLEIFEFVTGLPGDLALKGELRSFLSIVKLARRQVRARARRGALLQLPPCWDRQGLYQMDVLDSDVQVKHRYLGTCVSISKAQLPPAEGGYVLVDNYSEKRAAIASATRTEASSRYFLINHFQEQEVVCEAADSSSDEGEALTAFLTPPPKRRSSSRSLASASTETRVKQELVQHQGVAQQVPPQLAKHGLTATDQEGDDELNRVDDVELARSLSQQFSKSTTFTSDAELVGHVEGWAPEDPYMEETQSLRDDEALAVEIFGAMKEELGSEGGENDERGGGSAELDVE